MSKPMPLIRWTPSRAGKELSIEANQISKLLNAAQIQPGADGFYSTRDICAAVYNSNQVENLRRVRHQANILEIKEMEMRRLLLPTHVVLATWSHALLRLRQIIWGSVVSDQLKQVLLDDLREIGVDDYLPACEVKAPEDEPA